MREILFRGKRLDDGEWVYGGYFNDNGSHFIPQGIGAAFVEVDPKTVGQFTGLLDKNGKMIFEGDIIKNKYNSIIEIKFGEFKDTKRHDQVGFYQVYLDEDDWAVVSYGNMDDVEDSEIIGNIHDNGDLYKESKGEIK
jgi:uncharacterized phage protein (TIGR01671 family)